jgi:hypothetical protein
MSTDYPTPEQLERAIEIAVSAHKGQRDKAGQPYILHPLRLMGQVEPLEEKILAILHDVVEDSDWTLEALAAEGFPSHLVHYLDRLTRRPGDSYEEYIGRILGYSLAVRIKKLDLEDNLRIFRIAEMGIPDWSRTHYYHTAYRRLLAWEERGG